MRELAEIASKGYDNNTYNIDCRSYEIMHQDRDFIETGYERMVYKSVEDNIKGYTPRILDLGCGCGVPYTRELAKYGNVLGCDISASQIGCARYNVPSGRFVQKDVLDLHLRNKYDIVAMFHSFFNIAMDDKPILLGRINYWLKDHGVVLITTYGDTTEVKESDDFHGYPMVWHHVSTSDFEKLVLHAGFCVVSHDWRPDIIGSKETHLWILEKA